MVYIWDVGAAQGHGDVELIPCSILYEGNGVVGWRRTLWGHGGDES